MRKQTLIAILTTSAFVLTALPFLEGQFPAESTIPKSKRKGNGRVKKGPAGPTPRMADGHVDLLVGSGGGSVPLATFLANWVPVDEDDEVTNRVG